MPKLFLPCKDKHKKETIINKFLKKLAIDTDATKKAPL